MARSHTLLFLIGLALLLRAGSLVPEFIDDDEAWFASQAMSLHSPGTYFTSSLDNKPPGTAWFYRVCLEVFGPSQLPRAARAMSLLFVLAASLWLGGIAERMGGSNAVAPRRHAVALLFLLALPIASPKCLSVTNESLMIPLLVLAVSLVTPRALASLVRFGTAGALVGAATLFKQTGIFFLLPLCFAARRLREGMAACAGALLVLGVGVVWLGPSETWYWCFVYPRETLSAARDRLFPSASEALTTIAWFSIALFPLAKAFDRSMAYDRRVVFSWLAAALAAIGIGKGLFLHYFLLLIPPLCLIGSPARALSGRGGKWLWVGYAFACTVSALPASGLFWGADLAYFSRVAYRSQRITSPDEPVLFWGGSPLPGALARRPGTGRFLTPRFAVPPYSTQGTESLFESDFRKSPPPLVVDLHVRADNRFDLPPEALPWLGTELRAGYVSLADPGLPWARFFVAKERAAQAIASGLCPTSETVWNGPADAYPIALRKLAELWEEVPARFLSEEHSLRERFAAEIAERLCPGRSAPPEGSFPVASGTWWISLAVAEMQPAAHRK